MQTYVFTVLVQGEDVQKASATLRENVIDMLRPDGVDIHVTESVRAYGEDE